MTFVALSLLIISLILLYAAYKDVSPFVVMRAFIEHKDVADYAANDK